MFSAVQQVELPEMQTSSVIPTAHWITSVEECNTYCIFPNILERTILFLPLWLRKVRATEAGFMGSDIRFWFFHGH